ncbi:MAG: MarR family transcriptional regulator [Nitrospirae bacterium]|nr:MarR family transcriptional regulator [Nitrospirota bacterium]MBI3351946.1 MarR family transcriptional regulator [Nitrospirota bacterium]
MLKSFDRKTADDAEKEVFLKVLRPLVETYLAFLRKDERHIRRLGLTTAQFDVIATLGNTSGMSCKELSDQTLVTKGTLTGVLDRLKKKGLIERIPSKEDRRSIFVRLTPKGNKSFREVFPAHIYFLKPFFENALTPEQMAVLREMLLKLKESFEK